MGDDEVVTCHFTDDIDTGATVNILSLDDEFHRGVLGIHEG